MKHPKKGNGFLLTFAGSVAVFLALGATDPASAYQRPGVVERVSVAPGGADPTLPTNGGLGGLCDSPAYAVVDVTPSGRFVVFATAADNLVPGDKNLTCDVFRWDRRTKEVIQVSLSYIGLSPTAGSSAALPSGPLPQSWAPSISKSGRYVAFASYASDLVPGDTNLFGDVFVRDIKAGTTTRVSIDSNGKQTELSDCTSGQTNIDSWFPTISNDGSRVAFASNACELVPNDDQNQDVFVHDLDTGHTTAVSVDPQGMTVGGDSPSMSGNGRYVEFSNEGGRLAQNQSNTNNRKVFVRDLKQNVTDLVSVGADGTDPELIAFHSTTQDRAGGRLLSRDGRFVTFTSPSPLVPNEPPATSLSFDLFVRDRSEGRTEKVNVDSYGHPLQPSGGQGSLSPDGRYVLFDTSSDSEYESEGGDQDVFVYDRITGQLDWVSKGTDGDPGCSDPPLGLRQINPLVGGLVDGSEAGALSDHGRYPAFYSCAHLTKGDENDAMFDFFTADRGEALGLGQLVASGKAVPLSLGGDTRFAEKGRVFDHDGYSDSVVTRREIGAELIGAQVAYRPELDDLVVTLELEDMPPTPALAAVTAGNVYGAQFEVGDHEYELRVASQGLAENGMTRAVFGLFSCDGGRLIRCEQIANLDGGFGTTGARVLVAMPLSSVGLEAGGSISSLDVFTALGAYDQPLMVQENQIVDRLRLGSLSRDGDR